MKGVISSQNTPSIGDATQLRQYLLDVASRHRTISIDPTPMATWIRERTILADVNTEYNFNRWFDLMSKSGAGFERADMLLLEEVI